MSLEARFDCLWMVRRLFDVVESMKSTLKPRDMLEGGIASDLIPPANEFASEVEILAKVEKD